MGTVLADDISQGAAGGDEFRTAPLWGLGQRIFFLHDGRTSDLLQAILAHSSTGSEANASIAAFNALTTAQKTGHFELPAFALKQAADSVHFRVIRGPFTIIFQKLQKLLLGVPPTNVNPGAVTLRTLVT
jgi:hypothetical protein